MKKTLLLTSFPIFSIAALLGTAAALVVPTNVKAMNRSVETVLDAIRKNYELEKIDCGDYSKITVRGIMKFKVSQYRVCGIGNLSVMTSNLGLMQMATVVLTPVERDIPLVSIDYIYMLGNRTCYVEFYDLVLAKDEKYASLLQELGTIRVEYDNLENVIPSSAWYDSLRTEGIYKKGRKSDDEQLIEILEKGIGAVITYSQTLPILNEQEHAKKAELQKQYSHGLIDNGGLATDGFVKSLGPEGTRDFFDKVLFACDES